MTILLLGGRYIVIKLLNGYIFWINVLIITLVYGLYRVDSTFEQISIIYVFYAGMFAATIL